MAGTINIALLGNVTTEYLSSAIEDECSKYFIEASMYNSPFNQYSQEVLKDDSGFYSSAPDLVILFLEGRELFPGWYDFNTLEQDSAKKELLVEGVYASIVHLAETIHSHTNAKLLINNFRIPYHSPLGILDSKYRPGLKAMVALLNSKLEAWAAGASHAYIFDYNGLCSYYGAARAEDRKMYYIAGSTMSFPFVKAAAKEYMRYILPLQSQNRKCLVLDLDNTLWGGVAGEDGISGVKLDISGPGRSFYDFQKEILNLYYKGIILAINSKNNPEDALNIIENHPHMVLKKEHFQAVRINWQDKVQNLREIARELNISVSSLVFFDDSPQEREYVKAMLPSVEVVEVPVDASKYRDILNEVVYFETLSITEEDKVRNKMYEANKKRLEAKQRFRDLEGYLASLGTRVEVEHANSFSVPRIAQLTQKTNQFNMTTKRYLVPDIEAMSSSREYLVFSCSVSDRFGGSGTVGVCIAELKGTVGRIDTFLLSCRVLGRNIEYVFLKAAAEALRKLGVCDIYAVYQRTEANRAYEDFYLNAGLTKISTEGAATTYILTSDGSLKDFGYISVIVK